MIRARAIALRRRRPDPQPWLLWAVLTAGLVMVFASAHGQATGGAAGWHS